MGPFSTDPNLIGIDTFTPTFEDIKVNVPQNTSSTVVNGILNNLPSIFSALGSIFGQQAQQQPQVQPKQDLTPVYLLGGAILIILLTRK